MVSGRNMDHIPPRDYLGMLGQRLTGYTHVQGCPIVGGSNKIGEASADIYVREGDVVVEHATRSLTIKTADPPAVVGRVKEIWRKDLRGPKLQDRSAQA